jgi:hypothetical protein
MIFLVITAISFYVIALIFIFWRVFYLRHQPAPTQTASIYSVIGPRIDTFAFYLVFFFKEIIRHIYLIILLMTRKIISILKFTSIRLERRFSKVINSVRGRGNLDNRGSASLFLQEIKEHQDKIRNEAKV